MKLYFDANVLIRAVEGDDCSAVKLRKILDLAEDGGCVIVTSELSLAETMVGPFKTLTVAPADVEALARERLYGSFAESNGVRMLAIDRDVLVSAAAIRARRPSLKLPDAIHLSTHIAAACEVFVSGDKRLLMAAAAIGERNGSVCSLEGSEIGALNLRLGL